MMKTNQLLSRAGIPILAMLLALASCKKDTAPATDLSEQPGLAGKPASAGFITNDMVMYWNDKTAIVLNAPLTPPAQTRYFAMVEIAVHDALNSIKPKYKTFALEGVHEKNADPNAAVAAAAYWTLKGMNLPGANPIDDWYTQSLTTITDGDAKQAGLALGKRAAEAIIANRANDNLATANLQLPAPDGVAPGEYRSTLPFSNPGMPKIKALQQWGTLMAPFVTESNSQFRVPPPYPVNSPEYLTDYNEVKAKGARVGSTRTAEESQIGPFWAERASLNWNRFVRSMVAQQKMDAWRTARLFALLHTALIDGVSAAFESKYHYFYWRPETAIRLGNNDGNDQTIGDPTWLPSYTESPNLAAPALNVNTPPMPDYPSAHAAYAGAAGAILAAFFGTDQISLDATSTTLPGVTRHYSSLAQTMHDYGVSRIYIGYHFRNAVVKGQSMGEQIGNYVFTHAFRETGGDQ